jgi:hypothetical protein
MKLSDPRFHWFLNIVRPFMRRSINKEVNEDKRVLDGLADKTPTLDGLKLSRFDRVLGLNRDRIERVYRGHSPLRSPETTAAVCGCSGDLQSSVAEREVSNKPEAHDALETT